MPPGFILCGGKIGLYAPHSHIKDRIHYSNHASGKVYFLRSLPV
jgi:hypothetical protein